MAGLDDLKGFFLNNYGILLTGLLFSKVPAMLPRDIATQQSHELCGAGSAPPYIQLTTEGKKVFLPQRNALKTKNLKLWGAWILQKWEASEKYTIGFS